MNEDLTYSWRTPEGKRIRVTVEPSPAQPNTCRFIVEPALYPEGGVHFSGNADASVSPLAEALFELDDVTEILIAGNSLTVTTAEAQDWGDYSAKIAGIVRDQIVSGIPAVAHSHTDGLPSADELRTRVQEVIDTSINPAVAAHGGVVRLLDVKGNNIFLEFGGGCQGCGMVSVTLKYGVERLLRDRVPEIGQILDTTDHASGTNPYYAPAAK
jgi:Fe-S cluster biogenesis protein NfuA